MPRGTRATGTATFSASQRSIARGSACSGLWWVLGSGCICWFALLLFHRVLVKRRMWAGIAVRSFQKIFVAELEPWPHPPGLLDLTELCRMVEALTLKPHAYILWPQPITQSSDLLLLRLFQMQSACEEVRPMLLGARFGPDQSVGLTQFEFAAIANLLPNTAEEAKALVPTLARVSSTTTLPLALLLLCRWSLPSLNCFL